MWNHIFWVKRVHFLEIDKAMGRKQPESKFYWGLVNKYLCFSFTLPVVRIFMGRYNSKIFSDLIFGNENFSAESMHYEQGRWREEEAYSRKARGSPCMRFHLTASNGNSINTSARKMCAWKDGATVQFSITPAPSINWAALQGARTQSV